MTTAILLHHAPGHLPKLASTITAEFIEGDELHPTSNLEKMSAGIPLDDADRWPWLDMIGAGMDTCIAEGKSVVVSCSALRQAYRDRLRSRVT